MKHIKKMILPIILCMQFSISYASPKQNQEMIEAVGKGQIGTVDRLLNEGVSPNLQEPIGGHTLLQIGIHQKDLEKPHNAVGIVIALLHAGADPNIQSNIGNTPLIYTVKYAQRLGLRDATSIVRLLLRNPMYPADKSIKNNEDETVFSLLAELREKDSHLATKIENLLNE